LLERARHTFLLLYDSAIAVISNYPLTWPRPSMSTCRRSWRVAATLARSCEHGRARD